MDEETECLKPRLYQLQLEEIAVQKNTIIHLPTGSGKTFIAGCLIKRFMYLIKKPWGEGAKRTFFLVNTVPLVDQQKAVIERICPVTVGAYSGEDRVDFWNKSKWDNELTKNEVLIMTSQILFDMLTHNYIRIEDINLIIFDECHQAVDDHPMRNIMKHFEECPTAYQPRVIGLTATLLNSNVKLSRVEETLRELERTFHGSIATVSENVNDVYRFSTNPQEILRTYNFLPLTEDVKEAIILLNDLTSCLNKVKLPQKHNNTSFKLQFGQVDISHDPFKVQKEVINMVASMSYHLQEMGAYGGTLCIVAYTILLERLKRRALTEQEEKMYSFTITQCTEVKTVLLKSMRNETGYEKIMKHSTPKIRLMLNILSSYKPQNDTDNKEQPLSAIIFTQQRFTSKILYNLLKAVKKENPEDFGFLNHDFVVGFNCNPYNNTREQHFTKKLSHQALLKFKNGDLNCIISTRVIEEGVDVPQCLLVIRYDLPMDYRSYVQSKGRARNKDSHYVMMVANTEHKKFMDKYQGYQALEGRLSQLILGNHMVRAAPTDEEIQSLYEEDEIPPYIHSNGKRLFASSCISLLLRYCSMLPHDQFTVISPTWILEKLRDKNVITIIMPISCPIKEPIKGKPFLNSKTAKRSAAMIACLKLLEMGELDHDTMLPKPYGQINYDQENLQECFPNWPSDNKDEDNQDGVPLPGTKNRVRKHKKVYPECLNGKPFSSGKQKFYLHRIKFNLNFEKPRESREKALYYLLQQDEGYGFLTMQPLPEICEFPMFLTIGDVTTYIDVNYAVIELDPNAFELVKRFHFFIFDQVLAIAKKFVVFGGTVNCLYVVPLYSQNGSFQIDWDVIRAYKEIPPVAVPSNQERRSMRVTRETYQNSVVTPWYRTTLFPDRYIVSDVLEYMTPNSRFDSDSFNTYADYYVTKYQLDIEGPKDQPLLEVRGISTRMNCLMPRAVTIKSFTEKQRKLVSQAQGDDKPKGFNEIFIPEFCVKYDYPGVLWYKAFMLPSICHRVTMLLVAYELRAEIASAIKYGQANLPIGKKWLPIEISLNVATKSLLLQVEEPTAINSVDRQLRERRLRTNRNQRDSPERSRSPHTSDRINDPIDENSSGALPRIVSMKESLYQLQKKKMSKEYAWEETAEPIDIERNLIDVTLMDIECYDTFVLSPIDGDKKLNDVRSPVKQPLRTAILPPPLRYSEVIELLSQTACGDGPELRDILKALTAIKSGDTFNLERVETLGDSFLKFASTLYLFHKFPKLNEGQLTNIKGRLIGNRNLFYAGEKIGLGGRMKVENFSPRNDFVVPGFFAPPLLSDFIKDQQIRPSFLIGMEFSTSEALTGKLSDKSLNLVRGRFTDAISHVRQAEHEPEAEVQNSMQAYIQAQAVSDKSVADCVESLVGTYLLSGGIEGAVLVLEWLKILPPQDNFIASLHKSVNTVIKEGKATENDIDRMLNYTREDIEKILDYKFKDPSFLLEALSHASYIRNRYTRSYERLEFLGDAILDFLITSHIYENCGDLKPGELTDLRSALVNNVTFASYVVKLGLHKYICTDMNPTLGKAIVNFAEHQEQRDYDIKEDVLFLIDEEECRIAEYIEVPKVLSDIFESLVGAIFLDSGGSLPTVWKTVYRIMWREIASFSQNVPKQPVRLLYEMIHACASFDEPKLTPQELGKVMIPVTFTKNGQRHTIYGVGSNKSEAKRAAAKLAIKILAI